MGEGKDMENTWEIKIFCLLSVSRNYGQEKEKVRCSKETRKLTKEDSVIKFSPWNIPGKIKPDNNLNIRRKQTSSLTPASNHLHTTSSSYHCSCYAGHLMNSQPAVYLQHPLHLHQHLERPIWVSQLKDSGLPSPQLPSPTPARCLVLTWRWWGPCLAQNLSP